MAGQLANYSNKKTTTDKLNEKINPYLAVALVFTVGLVFAFLILTSLNQPSDLQIGSQAASVKK